MSTGSVNLGATFGGGSGTGTVTEVDSGTGLTGGPITTTGTLAVDVGTAASKIPQLNTDSQIALADGTSSKPQYSFSSEVTTGTYRSAAGDVVMMVAGVQAVEYLKVGSNINIGFGPSGTVSSSAANPALFVSSRNGQQLWQYGNSSTGSLSQTVFQILNGTFSVNNATEIGNAAYLGTGYLSGGSWISATAFQSQFNIMSESSSGIIKFNVGGRTSGTERLTISTTAIVANLPINSTATQTTLTGSAGTALCSQPFQGSSYKYVVVYLSGYTDTGTQTYTFPTAFSHTPYIYGLTAGVAGATATTTTITFTVTTLTGFVFLEGF